MQTSSEIQFWARIRGTCSRRLSVHSESILVTIALIAGGRSGTLRQTSRESRSIPELTSASRQSPSTGCAEHCSNSVSHEAASAQRRLCANCCHGEIGGCGGNKCEIS